MTAEGGVPGPRSRRLRGLVAIVAAAVVVGTTIVVGSSSQTGPSSPPRASAVTPTVAPSATAEATPTGTWQPVALEPYAPTADLVATKRDPAGVEPDTTFTLTSRTATPAVELAAGLEVSPAVSVSVQPGSTASQAIVTPAKPLAAGATYRFRLRADSGSVAGSWLFRAKAPLHVVSTLPGDAASGVPIRTGIEATFDQEPIAGYLGRVAIEPAVPFDLETHGRTLAIVPGNDLAERTLYTVTISRGISVAGSDMTLEKDVVFRFETAGAVPPAGPTVDLGKAVLEVSPSEPPDVAVGVCCWNGSEWSDGSGSADSWHAKTIDRAVEVYRFASLDAAVAAARRLATAPTWSEWSDVGLVATDGLARALTFTARLEPAGQAGALLRFPSKLAAGWYLVVLPEPGRDRQMVLQVTSVAVYARVTETRTLAWVNDTASGRPIPGATVTLAGGKALGRTDAEGLLVVATPAELLGAPDESAPPAANVLIVRAASGAAVFAPLGLWSTWSYLSEQDNAPSSSGNERHWLLFYTDRDLYRSSDTVNVWGLVRGRDSGSVPASVQIRLMASANQADVSAPAIASATAAPDRAGAFTAALAYRDLPLGSYLVELVVDGQRLSTLYLTIDEVRKPAYRIDLTLDRHVLIAGDPLSAEVQTVFYDGTRAPGLELALTGQGDVRVTTGADGRATAALRARLDSDASMDTPTVNVTAARPEEGSIQSSAPVLVFASAAWLSGTAALRGSQLTVSGRDQAVDIERLERDFEPYEWVDDPGGQAIVGGQVQVSIREQIPHRRETGRTYDFINKVTVPTYEYWTEEKTIPGATPTTTGDGTFTLKVAVPDATHSYKVVLSTTDAAGRLASATLWASPREPSMSQVEAWPRLVAAPGAGAAAPASCCGDTYRVGESLKVSLEGSNGPLPSSPHDRFLFIVEQRGLREASARTTSTFELALTVADLPNVWLSAVQFDGRAYLPTISSLDARVVDATRALTVSLTADAARYRPGANVTLTVRTTGSDGRPAASTVLVEVVDEKLYTIGAARSVDPLSDLYATVGSGSLLTYASHAIPVWAAMGGGGSTTGGGGGRGEFRDWLLFRQITTDAEGRASVSFKLSDDLTSWRASAAAVDERLGAGSATLLVPVGLPFFVEATLAPEFLVGDRPVLRLRADGEALLTGDPVSFTVASSSLGLKETQLSGRAFEVARLPLPALARGDQELVIAASVPGHDPPLADKLIRRFRVVDSRLQTTESRWSLLDASFVPTGGSGMTTYVVTDAGRGHLAAILERLAGGDGARVDQALGAKVAGEVLVAELGRDGAELPDPTFDRTRYQKWGEGVGLLPYSSPDLMVTAGVAMAAPDAFDTEGLRQAFETWGSAETATRERALIALAGRAMTGETVLADLGSLARYPDLSFRERLYLGLAYAALGDDATARQIEREVVQRYGASLGPWVRLEVSASPAEIVEATGLLAVLAAGLGDPIAERAQAYVEANPPRDDLLTLEQLAFVRRSLDRFPTEAGRFAYTVGGVRRAVALEPGESFTLALTPEQRDGLRFEPLAGRLAIVTSSHAPLATALTTADPDVTITRTVTPSGALPGDRIVRVQLIVEFRYTASDVCYEVEDRLPSGLAPLASTAGWPDASVGTGLQPFLVQGQLVSWCVGPEFPTRTATLAYSARVVSPGTYVWEPALVRSSAGPGRVSLTPEVPIAIQ